jgi:hypothetical protein
MNEIRSSRPVLEPAPLDSWHAGKELGDQRPQNCRQRDDQEVAGSRASSSHGRDPVDQRGSRQVKELADVGADAVELVRQALVAPMASRDNRVFPRPECVSSDPLLAFART